MHYVDNELFHAALVKRREDIDKVLVSLNFIDLDKVDQLTHEERKVLIKKAKLGNHIPPISDYIAESFLKMAENISYKKNFQRYPYKDEMIGDAIIDCIRYVDTFDSSRENPFAYFTSTIGMAFIRRIIKEKKEGYVKSKILSKSDLDVFNLQDHDEDGDFTNSMVEFMNTYNNFDGSMFEKKPRQLKETKYNGPSLEDFL